MRPCMAAESQVVAGIDVAASRPCTAVVWRPGRPIEEHDWFATHDVPDLIAWVVARDPAVVAIDAPQGYNRHLARTADGELKPRTLRACDWEMRRRAIPLYQVPSRTEFGAWPSSRTGWLAVGFALFKGFIKRGFEPPRQAGLPGSFGQPSALLEVYPHATFVTLAGHGLPAKTTHSGARQRIALLREYGLAWDYYFDHDSLDALAAALTGRRYVQNLASPVGDAEEGLLWLPVPALKDKYDRA
jgi:hypothetical protein